jgi:hypothetical protein
MTTGFWPFTARCLAIRNASDADNDSCHQVFPDFGQSNKMKKALIFIDDHHEFGLDQRHVLQNMASHQLY